MGIDDNHNGNGHGQSLEDTIELDGFNGAKVSLKEMKEQEGAVRSGPANQSFLHRMASADLINFDNEIKIALYNTPDEADDAVAALTECEELGMDPTPIMRQILARSADKNHGLLRLLIDTLHNSTFTINRNGKDNGRKRGNSPIS